MTLSEFKDLAAAIQSLVLALAVIAGGAWALYRFLSLKSIDKARAELQQLRKSMVDRGTINITINASTLTDHPPSRIYIQILVSISNVGSRTEVLNVSKATVETARLLRDSKLHASYDNPRTVRLHSITYKESFETVDPGQTVHYPFVVPVMHGGIYLCEFSVPSSPEEANRALAEGTKAGVGADVINWSSKVYVQVPGASDRKTTNA